MSKQGGKNLMYVKFKQSITLGRTNVALGSNDVTT
jgi:hypothetical protein